MVEKGDDGMTEKEVTEIKQGRPTKITLDMMVLSEFDNIPFDVLETSIVNCLNIKMNCLGISFKNMKSDVE